MKTKEFTIFVSLSDDVNDGRIWLPKSLFNERVVVRVQDCDTGKSVYCEAVPAGKRYAKRHLKETNLHALMGRNDFVVINEWYRQKLGFDKIEDQEGDFLSGKVKRKFRICKCDNLFGHYMAGIHHPQIVVRLATRLGVLGLILGVISLMSVNKEIVKLFGSFWNLVVANN